MNHQVHQYEFLIKAETFSTDLCHNHGHRCKEAASRFETVLCCIAADIS